MTIGESQQSGRGWAIAALIVSLVSLLLAFETFRGAILPQKARVARKFVVVDPFDNTRARLEADVSGALLLHVYDDRARPLISVEFGSDEAGPLVSATAQGSDVRLAVNGEVVGLIEGR